MNPEIFLKVKIWALIFLSLKVCRWFLLITYPSGQTPRPCFSGWCTCACDPIQVLVIDFSGLSHVQHFTLYMNMAVYRYWFKWIRPDESSISQERLMPNGILSRRGEEFRGWQSWVWSCYKQHKWDFKWPKQETEKHKREIFKILRWRSWKDRKICIGKWKLTSPKAFFKKMSKLDWKWVQISRKPTKDH